MQQMGGLDGGVGGKPNLDVSTETPPSREEKGLVTIKCFLGCAKSAVLIFLASQ